MSTRVEWGIGGVGGGREGGESACRVQIRMEEVEVGEEARSRAGTVRGRVRSVTGLVDRPPAC